MAKRKRTSNTLDDLNPFELSPTPDDIAVLRKRLAELDNRRDIWIAVLSTLEKKAGLPLTFPDQTSATAGVITRRRHSPYPTEPIKDLEVVEGSRAYEVHKILTEAGRPVNYHYIRDKFAETPLGKNMRPQDKPYYSGVQALKKIGHCVPYKRHLTTPDVLKKFKTDVAAGLVADIEELPRFNSRWSDAIAKYLKIRSDWISSKEIADYLSTLPEFKHLKHTHVRTCTVLYNMQHKRGLVEKKGQGKGAKWRLKVDGNSDEEPHLRLVK
jgi:hypothetical protein